MKLRLWAALAGVTLLTAACNPGSYPVDIFSEMHYTPSQHRLQPNRLAPPPDAVPVTGGRASNIPYSRAGALSNPVPATTANLDRGGRVFAANCSSCHGEDGHGDGPVAKYFRGRGSDIVPVAPPDMRSPLVRSYNDGQLYWVIANGVGNMPAFKSLLSDQDEWALVDYLHEVQSRP